MVSPLSFWRDDMKKLNLAPYQVRRYVTRYGSGWLVENKDTGEAVEYYDDEGVMPLRQANTHRNMLNSRYGLDKIGV